MLTTENLQLVAQHQDLDLFSVVRAEAQQNEVDHAPQCQVHEGPDHQFSSISDDADKTRHRSRDASTRTRWSPALRNFWHPTGHPQLVAESVAQPPEYRFHNSKLLGPNQDVDP